MHNTQPIKQTLCLLMLILLLFIPALHKLQAAMPPPWFVQKFETSLIASFPSGLSLSFGIIVLLELIGPLLMFIALLQLLRKKSYQGWLSYAFLVYYSLFIILTFGSFLVQDYDNGFKDFMYFVGILLIEQHLFSDANIDDVSNA